VPALLSSILTCVVFFVNQSGSAETRQASGNPNTTFIESAVSCTDRAYAEDLPSPGPACEKELFRRRGRPLMFPARDGIAFGVSSGPDKPSELYLWVDNQTDKAVSLSFCCVSTLFAHIDIFDSEGHRVLSKVDRAEQKARSEGREIVQVCTCSGSSAIPSHRIQLFVFADISEGYTLQPGRYTISERNPPAPYNLGSDGHEVAPHSQPGLAVSIP
jgi:hypothetical protein